jgi:predicted nucleic acid-binding protein
VKLVIDASIGIKQILPESDSAKALQIQSDFRRGIHEILAPDLYFVEVSNVLTMAARTGKISAADLPYAFGDMIRYQPVIHNTTTCLHSAFNIASKLQVSVYDAIYLALSRQENCPLLTADHKLINAAKGFSFLTLDQI